MTFKEQLEATVQEGRDYNAITAEVKEILLAAAKVANLMFSYH